MRRYNSNLLYTRLERLNSILVISLQVFTLFNMLQAPNNTPLIANLAAFILAYILTDFINGLIHMYMDNNTDYASLIGPFISSFHLHHSKLKYTHSNPFKIYFYESGTKFWLSVYLIILVWIQHYFVLAYALNVCLVSIGILSSIAELSHYWCHNATKKNKLVSTLQRYRILLAKKHHLIHHRDDNTHYAFLNGISDPLLNKISRYYYTGYKNHADQHAKAYLHTLRNEKASPDIPVPPQNL